MEFYIKPEYRLNNYGRLMYEYIENIFNEKNIKTIILTSNERSIAFWEKLKFLNSGKIDPTNNLTIYLKII